MSLTFPIRTEIEILPSNCITGKIHKQIVISSKGKILVKCRPLGFVIYETIGIGFCNSSAISKLNKCIDNKDICEVNENGKIST